MGRLLDWHYFFSAPFCYGEGKRSRKLKLRLSRNLAVRAGTRQYLARSACSLAHVSEERAPMRSILTIHRVSTPVVTPLRDIVCCSEQVPSVRTMMASVPSARWEAHMMMEGDIAGRLSMINASIRMPSSLTRRHEAAESALAPCRTIMTTRGRLAWPTPIPE